MHSLCYSGWTVILTRHIGVWLGSLMFTTVIRFKAGILKLGIEDAQEALDGC